MSIVLHCSSLIPDSWCVMKIHVHVPRYKYKVLFLLHVAPHILLKARTHVLNRHNLLVPWVSVQYRFYCIFLSVYSITIDVIPAILKFWHNFCKFWKSTVFFYTCTFLFFADSEFLWIVRYWSLYRLHFVCFHGSWSRTYNGWKNNCIHLLGFPFIRH